MLNRKLTLVLCFLGLILGGFTVFSGANEATKDLWDPIGSNYWLAYSAIACGAALIVAIGLFIGHQRKAN